MAMALALALANCSLYILTHGGQAGFIRTNYGGKMSETRYVATRCPICLRYKTSDNRWVDVSYMKQLVHIAVDMDTVHIRCPRCRKVSE